MACLRLTARLRQAGVMLDRPKDLFFHAHIENVVNSASPGNLARSIATPKPQTTDPWAANVRPHWLRASKAQIVNSCASSSPVQGRGWVLPPYAGAEPQ
jgi:hypothetical protein